MKRKISTAIFIAVLSIGHAYNVLYAAHKHIPHMCPKAKRAHDHHCDKHGSAFQDADPASVPQDCICPVSCFFQGQGLPVE